MNSDSDVDNICGYPLDRSHSRFDALSFLGISDSTVSTLAALKRTSGALKAGTIEEFAKKMVELRGPVPGVSPRDVLPAPFDVHSVVQKTDLPIVGPDAWRPTLTAIERAYADLMRFVAYQADQPSFSDLSDHERTHFVLRVVHAILKNRRHATWSIPSSNEEAFTEMLCGEGDPRKRKALLALDVYLELYMLVNEFNARDCATKCYSKSDYKLLSDAQASLQSARTKLVALRSARLWNDEFAFLNCLEKQLENIRHRAKAAESDVSAPKPKIDVLKSFIVGPLLDGYTELFGYFPGRSSDGLSGPWSRFGVNFFNMVGKNVTTATLHTALKDAPRSLLGMQVTSCTVDENENGVRRFNLKVTGTRPRPNRSHRASSMGE